MYYPYVLGIPKNYPQFGYLLTGVRIQNIVILITMIFYSQMIEIKGKGTWGKLGTSFQESSFQWSNRMCS